MPGASQKSPGRYHRMPWLCGCIARRARTPATRSHRRPAREAGKPENLLDRIAEGALQKFYKESTLLQQEYVKDPKKTIEQFLKESDKELAVTVFKRVSLNV